MPKLRWLRGLIVPVSILCILFVAFVGYYLYWVPSRERLLDDRGFRYLKTLSDQIRLSLNTFDKMMDNALDSGIIVTSSKAPWELDEGVTRKNLEKFLANVVPQLSVVHQAEVTQIIKEDYGDPPKIAFSSDEGTHFLYFAFSHNLRNGGSNGEKLFRFAVRTDLDQAINRLLGPPNLSPFDVVLISQGDGKVIFQKSLSGVEVAAIRKLEDASGGANGKEKKESMLPGFRP